jgi:hypothetical protein
VGLFIKINIFPLNFAFLTHPYPSQGGDNVLLLCIYPFEFRLSLTAIGVALSHPRLVGLAGKNAKRGTKRGTITPICCTILQILCG